jgi:hypothetical protein
MKKLLLLVISSLMSVPAMAFVLDGSIAGDGYTLRAVQTVNTGFGDNLSELDAGYATISGGNLHLALTGNLENNLNALNIFIDSVAGGENRLTSDINNGGNNPTNSGWANKHAGMIFDSGFATDYMLILRNGFLGVDVFNIDFSSVGSNSTVETAGNVFGGSLTGSNANALPGAGIGVAFDDSNLAGVTGFPGAANQLAAAAVQTGIELVIPLASIGNPGAGDTILISAMINGSNHDYLSNQVLGGLSSSQGNLGGDGTGIFTGNLSGIDFNRYVGNQYFSVPVPTPVPAAVWLFGSGLLGLIGVCRRKQLD